MRPKTTQEIEKALDEYHPRQRSSEFTDRVRELALAHQQILTDDQLETELHLLAILLERHEGLITIMTDDGELAIGSVQDFSAELNKSIVIFVRG